MSGTFLQTSLLRIAPLCTALDAARVFVRAAALVASIGTDFAFSQEERQIFNLLTGASVDSGHLHIPVTDGMECRPTAARSGRLRATGLYTLAAPPHAQATCTSQLQTAWTAVRLPPGRVGYVLVRGSTLVGY